MVENAQPPLTAAPNPNAKPPSMARPVSDHPLTPVPSAGMSQKIGIATAHTQSTDFPTLATI